MVCVYALITDYYGSFPICKTDTERIFWGLRYGAPAMGAILSAIVGTGFMIWVVGWESLIGLLVLIFSIPLNMKMVYVHVHSY